MSSGLLHRADCHALGTVATAARVAHPELAIEPLNLCSHDLHKHAAELIRQGWVIERLSAASDECVTEGMKA